ncbi:hypothetical protein XENOCAPTIV_028211 [Xenoophorus captivus]|uniref:Uncharacterized protein n=1 Tax=Xenoophorus captivus TaxID=1517983 RepID=A0ABV0QND8_9TELE
MKNKIKFFEGFKWQLKKQFKVYSNFPFYTLKESGSTEKFNGFFLCCLSVKFHVIIHGHVFCLHNQASKQISSSNHIPSPQLSTCWKNELIMCSVSLRKTAD